MSNDPAVKIDPTTLLLARETWRRIKARENGPVLVDPPLVERPPLGGLASYIVVAALGFALGLLF